MAAEFLRNLMKLNGTYTHRTENRYRKKENGIDISNLFM